MDGMGHGRTGELWYGRPGAMPPRGKKNRGRKRQKWMQPASGRRVASEERRGDPFPPPPSFPFPHPYGRGPLHHFTPSQGTLRPRTQDLLGSSFAGGSVVIMILLCRRIRSNNDGWGMLERGIIQELRVAAPALPRARA